MSSRRLWDHSKQKDDMEESASLLPPISNRSNQLQSGRESVPNRPLKHRDSIVSQRASTRSFPALKRRESLMAYEPVIVKFVKNGDKFFEGVKVNVSKRTVKSWEVLLSELSSRIQLPAGVRNIYTPEHGHKVTRLSQLEHQGIYVCGSTEPFKRIDYSSLKHPDWKSTPKTRHTDNLGDSVFSLPRTFSTDLNASMQSVREGRLLNSSLSSSMSENHLPLRKRPRKLKPLRQTSLSAPDENLETPELTNLPLHDIGQESDNVNITIFRNGPLPRERASVSTNKDISWEELKQLISKKFLSINGCLRLFTLSGTPVTSVEELWNAGSILIAAGAEKFDISNFLSGESDKEKDQPQSSAAPITSETPDKQINQDDTSIADHKATEDRPLFTSSPVERKANSPIEKEPTSQANTVDKPTEQEYTTEDEQSADKHSENETVVNNCSVTEKEEEPPNKEVSFTNIEQEPSESTSTPSSPPPPFPLEDIDRRPRTLSLLSEKYSDLQSYGRPASVSSDELDTPVGKGYRVFPRNVLPKTPQSELSIGLGGAQSMIDMMLPKLARLLTESELGTGSESSYTPTHSCRRSVGIQTEFISDRLSAVIDVHQQEDSEVDMDVQVGVEAVAAHTESAHSKAEHDPHSHRHTRDKYNMGLAMHEGRYASVKTCTSKADDREYFVRVINKAKIFWNDDPILREVKILTKLRHEHIMRVIDHWETSEEICMVMEPTEGSDLYDCVSHCKVFSEADTVKVMRQLGLALVYLHANRIVHRDIRLENIFLTIQDGQEWSLKLGGFSLATSVTEPLCLECGKEYFRAPEMRARTGYSAKVDVWAAGVLCYLLLSGKMPFARKSRTNRIGNVSADKLFPSAIWSELSESSMDFIQCLLRLNPQQRFSSSEMLQHAWLNEQPRAGREEKSHQLMEHITAAAAENIAPVLILSVTALDHRPKNKQLKLQ